MSERIRKKNTISLKNSPPQHILLDRFSRGSGEKGVEWLDFNNYINNTIIITTSNNQLFNISTAAVLHRAATAAIPQYIIWKNTGYVLCLFILFWFCYFYFWNFYIKHKTHTYDHISLTFFRMFFFSYYRKDWWQTENICSEKLLQITT